MHPDIATYIDALYFTVSALTSTGVRDIALPGAGRLLRRALEHSRR